LSSEEHARLAPFLTVLGTHHISRILPHPPQRMPASPAAAPAAASPPSLWTPAPRHTHTQSRPSTTRVCSMLCERHPPLHAGRRVTLEASCCLHPAPPPAVVGPAPDAHPVVSTRPIDLTPRAHAAFSVSTLAVARCPPPDHAGSRGNTL
jgi:hypothetical protein